MNFQTIAEARMGAKKPSASTIFSVLGDELIREALLIRAVEISLLDEFQMGNISGTIHTCIGQEIPSILIGKYLNHDDFVTSNHRCHGHFISKTKNWKGLVLEILGSKDGVCRGVGSSQHLSAPDFLSNGPQGSLIPVGTGIASEFKSRNSRSISVSFFGEGTFGEGILYESMNLASTLSVPQLFVCENNFYSQSTPQNDALAGSITARAESFGIQVFECDIWDIEKANLTIEEAIKYVRENSTPAFLLIQCYRLKAHSKGDDNRELSEIEYFESIDPISFLTKSNLEVAELSNQLIREAKKFIADSLPVEALSSDMYFKDQLPRSIGKIREIEESPKIRLIESLRVSIESLVSDGAILIGEDIVDPYGGAFKATKGISTKFPPSVISTPISEAAIVGYSIGRAILGTRTIVEIMFGDFVTYAFDQLISNASKMHNVYNRAESLPLIVRIPNGGHRGYGPTHSQSLEKHLVGIDNLLVVALTSLVSPAHIYNYLIDLTCPSLVIENKVGYAKILFQNPDNLIFEGNLKSLTNLSIRTSEEPEIQIYCYGEFARQVVDSLTILEQEFQTNIEVVCLIQLHPMRLPELRNGTSVLVVEEGSKEFGIGAEVAAQILENNLNVKFARISAEPYPIPSNRNLEELALPNLDKLRSAIRKMVTSNVN